MPYRIAAPRPESPRRWHELRLRRYAAWFPPLTAGMCLLACLCVLYSSRALVRIACSGAGTDAACACTVVEHRGFDTRSDSPGCFPGAFSVERQADEDIERYFLRSTSIVYFGSSVGREEAAATVRAFDEFVRAPGPKSFRREFSSGALIRWGLAGLVLLTPLMTFAFLPRGARIRVDEVDGEVVVETLRWLRAAHVQAFAAGTVRDVQAESVEDSEHEALVLHTLDKKVTAFVGVANDVLSASTDLANILARVQGRRDD